MITRREPDELEGENVYSEMYEPSKAQFDRYLAREVELCRTNIATCKKSEDGAIVLLHSWATVLEVVTGIKVERKPLSASGDVYMRRDFC